MSELGMEKVRGVFRRRKIPIELPQDDDHESPMAALQRAS